METFINIGEASEDPAPAGDKSCWADDQGRRFALTVDAKKDLNRWG
jgi:hypothetical protein